MIIELIFFICFIAGNVTVAAMMEKDPTFDGLVTWSIINCSILIIWMKKHKLKKFFE